jgi:hypothetical protein
MLLLSHNFHDRILTRTNLNTPPSFAARATRYGRTLRATEPFASYFEAVGPPGQPGTS